MNDLEFAELICSMFDEAREKEIPENIKYDFIMDFYDIQVDITLCSN